MFESAALTSAASLRRPHEHPIISLSCKSTSRHAQRQRDPAHVGEVGGDVCAGSAAVEAPPEDVGGVGRDGDTGPRERDLEPSVRAGWRACGSR